MCHQGSWERPHGRFWNKDLREEAREYLGKRIPGTGNPGAKTKQESSWHVTGMARRPVWLKLSE